MTTAQAQTDHVSSIPTHRIGAVEEVAAIVAWFCSERVSFISGATIPIDGDKLARGARADG